jgi:hypothetical protein
MSRHAPPWLLAAVRFTLVELIAVALLLGTTLVCALPPSLLTGGPFLTPMNLTIGLICSLIAWLFIAAFHLRRETVTLLVPEREQFLHHGRLLLTEMGYEVTARGPLQVSTRPRFQSLLFGGGVQVVVTGTHGHLVGPKVCVEILRSRLRVQSHLARCHEALRDSRCTETLVKRAELKLRVKPADLPTVQANVIEVLRSHGEVICDLHLLAQSETGIPESVLDFQVSQWLEQQKIDATLHKHFVQLHRPLSNGEIALDIVG